MSDILLATKLHIPPLHGNLVNRQYLIGRLNEGINQSRRLTLISAPAGYGKSAQLNERKIYTMDIYSPLELIMILVTSSFPLKKTQAGMTGLLSPWSE